MRIAVSLASFLFACGSAPSGGFDAGADAGFDAATTIDCGAGSTPSSTYPAPHPALPFAKSAGGPTMAQPHIVPVVFAAEDRTSDIAAFTKAIGASSYWASIATQYGVGAATAIAPIVVSETPPATLTDADVIAWLQGKLDGAHVEFGSPDPSSIYVVYYPGATTIQTSWGDSCVTWGGYHSEAMVGATSIVYAVIARCVNGVHSMTGITSHELFEAATDPHVWTTPAYDALDDDGKLQTYQAEIGDLCQDEAEVVSSELGYPVHRIWSNAASLAGHDPCQPAVNAPYFQTIADVSGPGRSVALPAGATTTVDLVAFSDADTGGPWTIKVTGSWTSLDDELTLSLCRTSARNGERVPLTITRPAASQDTNWITIESTLGGVSTWSSLFVGY